MKYILYIYLCQDYGQVKFDKILEKGLSFVQMPLTKKIVSLALTVSVFLLIFFPSEANAWGGDVHDYLCPTELRQIPEGCRIADGQNFQTNYPYAGTMNHLCLDNKPDCPPRIVAKYYVKRYYVEGKKDLNLLAGAAHLIQDSYVPDHWFPMREFGKRIFVPFAPSWVSETEGAVSLGLSSKQPGWSVSRQYQGKTIILNQAYMDELREEVALFVATQPPEDLATLEKQIKTRSFWQKVRSYREWTMVGLIILFPFLLFYAWKWLTKKTGKTDLTIIAFSWLIFLIFFGLTYAY